MAARINFLSSLMVNSLILSMNDSNDSLLTSNPNFINSYFGVVLIREPASQIFFIKSLLNRYRFSS